MKLNKLSYIAATLLALSASTAASAQSNTLTSSTDTTFSLTCKVAQLMPVLLPSGLLAECALLGAAIVDPSTSPNKPTPSKQKALSIVDPRSGPQTGTKSGK